MFEWLKNLFGGKKEEGKGEAPQADSAAEAPQQEGAANESTEEKNQ